MSDLIDRQAAIEIVGRYNKSYMILKGKPMLGAASIVIELEDLPSAQPEMVKCKKCRYVYYDEEFDNYWCNRMSDSFKVEADGYCKWGK